jgi:hypothetical protein
VSDLRTVVVGDGWSLEVPADLAEEREANNALVLWDDRRTIRIRTLTAALEDGSPVPAQVFAEDVDDRYRVERDDDLILEVRPMLQETIEGETVWTVPVRAIAEGSVMLPYFHFRSDGDEAWARERAMSIRHSP